VYHFSSHVGLYSNKTYSLWFLKSGVYVEGTLWTESVFHKLWGISEIETPTGIYTPTCICWVPISHEKMKK
jgi:hypothetical protein